jgi:Family of unknown function (DUF6308)
MGQKVVESCGESDQAKGIGAIDMTRTSSYTEWRRFWPDLIVHAQTDTAVDHLQRYYSVYEDGQPRYSGSQFESMAALNSDPNALGPADFLAVSMLSVNVPAEAAIRLLDRDAATINQLLSQIPSDVDIVDADSGMLDAKSPAGLLWDVLRRSRDGLGPTITSKLLAAKRPRLLPIWDSFVEEATGLGTIDYWSKFHYVLADDQRLVWEWLRELRPLAPNMPASVPELRIFDVLLWMSVEGRTKPSRG